MDIVGGRSDISSSDSDPALGDIGAGAEGRAVVVSIIIYKKRVNAAYTLLAQAEVLVFLQEWVEHLHRGMGLTKC